jgi:hypothetical protein
MSGNLSPASLVEKYPDPQLPVAIIWDRVVHRPCDSRSRLAFPTPAHFLDVLAHKQSRVRHAQLESHAKIEEPAEPASRRVKRDFDQLRILQSALLGQRIHFG